MQVERSVSADSGERVSNALVTCPEEWDNRPKGLLIPHEQERDQKLSCKAERRFGRGLRPIS
jgi:hypothetical protein